MPPLLYLQKRLVKSAGKRVITFTELPNCKIRIINVQNNTAVSIIDVVLMEKNAVLGVDTSISLMNAIEQVSGAKDLSWQGDQDIGINQKVCVTYNKDYVGTEPTDGDLLIATIGYELHEA